MRKGLSLDRDAASSQRADKLRGVYLGIVTNNEPDSGYMVKLKFPWLPSSADESFWARIVVPMAGGDRGTYFLPEVDDQVLVVFEHGDIRRPIVIGALWSEKQKPPEANGDGKNDFRVIKSRSGHRLIFDDTQGAERVILVDSTGKNKVVLDNANDSVTLESADGDIEIKASSGAARLHAKTVKITTDSDLAAKGGLKLQVATKGPLNAKASGDLLLKGATVQLNPDGYG